MRAPVVVARARETVRRATSASIEMRANVPWRWGDAHGREVRYGREHLADVGREMADATARGQVSSAVKTFFSLFELNGLSMFILSVMLLP